MQCKSLWIKASAKCINVNIGKFKGGLRCKGWVNSVIMNVIGEINYRCNYMQVLFLL